MKNTAQETKNGSVMIFAVLLMTAGVFVLAAVLQLAATQGLSGDAEWDALQRRVTLGNSRAMAREYMHSRIFRGTVPANTNATSVTFSNAQGGFSISPAGGVQQSYWTALSTTNTNVVLNINPFNLMERGGFYREVFAAQLLQGADDIEWSFALRTRSPIAAGYSFTQQRPANDDLGAIAQPPYIDMSRTTDQFFGFYGMPRVPMSSVTNVMTRGTGDTNGYQGYLDVPEAASVYGIFTSWTYEAIEPPSVDPQTLKAVVDLDLPDPNVPNSVLLLRLDASAADYTRGTNVFSNLPVRAVELRGTDAVRKPLHVVVPASNPNIAELTLINNNTRRVYFYRARTSNIGDSFRVSSDSSSWRLGLTMSQCDIEFSIGNLEITGGLRTDGEINFEGASPSFVPEDDPGGLDFIADRMMWLEDYRAQQ